MPWLIPINPEQSTQFDPITYRRYIMLHGSILLYLAVTLFFIFVNIIDGKYILVGIHCVGLVIALFFRLKLRYLEQLKTLGLTFISFVSLLILLVQTTPQSHPTIFVWLTVIPMAAMYMLEWRKGIIFSLTLITVVVLVFNPSQFSGSSALTIGPFFNVIMAMICSMVIGFLSDSSRQFVEERLLVESRLDLMTKTFNRNYFIDRFNFEAESHHRTHLKYCLIVIDIDHFKNINDSYGHTIGDVVLQTAASLMKQCIRTTDIIGRIGGEEFAIMLTNCDLDNAISVAEKIRSTIATANMKAENHQLQITISLGIASSNDEKLYYDQLFHIADSNLYQAKNRGRNQAISSINYNNAALI
jgi:diguanylate cyclase (GGDEF)-like protein